MDVAGWRLTPYSELDPLTTCPLSSSSTSSSGAYVETSIQVQPGHRFWLQLTHPPFTASSSSSPTQFELELSAGGNRVSRALLDVGDGSEVGVWMDGQGELDAVAVNSKAARVGVVGSWEWIDFAKEEDEDPLSLGNTDDRSRVPALSGALVLRLFPIAGKAKGGTPSGAQHGGGGGQDDRDANQVLEDYLSSQVGGRTKGKERHKDVDLAIRPQFDHSIDTPSSSHAFQALRSSLRSLKPATATWVLGFGLAPDPHTPNPSPEAIVDAPAATATAHGHPTPPSSTQPKSVPLSGSATYSRKDKKRPRAPTAESASSSEDAAGAGDTGAFQPVTPLPRGATKPDKGGKLSVASASSSSPSKRPATYDEKQPQGGNEDNKAQKKRRKTVQTTPAPTSSGAGKVKATSAPAVSRPGSRADSGVKGASSGSAPPAARDRSGSGDPMQLVASGDEMDDEIQVIKPPTSASQERDREAREEREAQRAVEAFTQADARQGLLDFGDAELFEKMGDDGMGPGDKSDVVVLDQSSAGDDLDEFVPAPNSLFSSDYRPPQPAAGFVGDQTTNPGAIDFSNFFDPPGEVIGGSRASESRAAEVSPRATGGGVARQNGMAVEIKDDLHERPPASAPLQLEPESKVKDNTTDEQAAEADEGEDELDEAHMVPLDHDIRDSVRQSLAESVASGTWAFTHQFIEIDVDGLRKEQVDISAELESIRAKLGAACQPSIIRSALSFLPELSSTSNQAPSTAKPPLPQYLADLRAALHRVIYNATVRQQTDMYDKLRAAWEPEWPGDVGAVVRSQREGTEEVMRKKVARFLKAEMRPKA